VKNCLNRKIQNVFARQDFKAQIEKERKAETENFE